MNWFGCTVCQDDVQRQKNWQIQGSDLKNSDISSYKNNNLYSNDAKKLKEEYQGKNKLFTDPFFKPDIKSLGPSFKNAEKKIKWKRINQIIQDPIFLDQHFNLADITSIDIQDCYFLTTISALAEVSSRIKQLFIYQEIHKNGIYIVRININGIPKDIALDNYFPVNYQNLPIFAKPKGTNQFWVMLIEKAWAKICGNYSQISTGFPHEVLKAFNKAPCFYYDLSLIQQDQLWKYLKQASENRYPMCAGSKSNGFNFNGIIQNYTYSITNCLDLQLNEKNYRILKIRNALVKEEYKGPFSEYDKQFWNQFDKNTKQSIGFYNAKYEKKFFIGLDEFLHIFQGIDISHIHEKYIYQYEEIHTDENCGGTYYEIDIKQHTQCYFMLHQSNKRSQISKSKKMHYSKATLVIAKKNKEFYQYINSKLEENLPDLTLRCPKLTKGKYIVYTRIQPNITNYMVFSTYSKSKLEFKKIQKDYSFFQKVFYNHALRISQKTLLGGNPNDWISLKLLYHEGGLAYIAVNIDTSSNKRVLLQIQKQKIEKSGYILKRGTLQFNNGMIFAEPGIPIVIVFRVKNESEEQLSFPPPIKVSQTFIQK